MKHRASDGDGYGSGCGSGCGGGCGTGIKLVYGWWSNSVYWQFDQADEWSQLPTKVAAFQWRHLIVQCGLIGLVRLLVAFKQQAVVPFTLNVDVI